MVSAQIENLVQARLLMFLHLAHSFLFVLDFKSHGDFLPGIEQLIGFAAVRGVEEALLLVGAMMFPMQSNIAIENRLLSIPLISATT